MWSIYIRGIPFYKIDTKKRIKFGNYIFHVTFEVPNRNSRIKLVTKIVNKKQKQKKFFFHLECICLNVNCFLYLIKRGTPEL